MVPAEERLAALVAESRGGDPPILLAVRWEACWILARSEEIPARLLAHGLNPRAVGCMNVCEVRRAGSAVVLGR